MTATTTGVPQQWSTFEELLGQAAQVLDPPVLDFILAGAGNETSLSRDRAAWDDIPLHPRTLADLTEIVTDTTLLGQRLSSPIAVAPCGGHGLAHPQAEAATARGAEAAGCLFVLSAYSNVSLENVAVAAPTGPKWFQLPHEVSDEEMAALTARAAASGYSAVVLTLDQVVMGDSPTGTRRAEDLRTDLTLANLPGRPVFVTGYHPRRQGLTPVRQSEDILRRLVNRSPLPVVVKGVLRGDDAVRCVDCGAAAVIVSNHGARHLDGTVPPARALPDVVQAVAGRVPVLVDGAIRQGEHVLRGLALGADAVLVGRAPFLGLALAGAEGVRTVLDQLTTQLHRAMALCGAGTIRDIGPDLVGMP